MVPSLFRALLVACPLAACSLLMAGAAQAPALPKDVAPLPPALGKKVEEMTRAAENYRGLPCKQAVPCGSVGKEGLKKKMLEAIAEELPPEKMAALEAGLKAFAFIPQEMVLGKYFPDLLTSQVGGFYDPKRKYLALVKGDDGVLGQDLKAQLGADVADRMEETVLVHELTHAIQDQHFDLEKFASTQPLSDEGRAREALVEGDATLTMYDFFSGIRLENLPGVDLVMGELLKDPKQLIAMSPDMPGSKEMAEAPAWFRDNLLFGYLQGFSFCVSIRRLGGQRLLDYAYTKDPPRSTEQVLHPEKWHTQRDDPVVLLWPELSQELPGYRKLCEGQLGEQSVRILLRENLKDEGRAAAAAAGWGGDRFAVYGKDGNAVLLWVTEWDSAQDSQEFKEAAVSLGAGWSVTAPGPTRVVVVRGKLSAAELAAVNGKLAAAKAQAPDNKKIDLDALGIKRGAGNKQGGLLGDLEGVLEGKGDLDIGALLNDPNVQKAAQEMLDQLGTENPGGLDMGKLLDDPQARDLIQKTFAQEPPPGQTSQDGRSYTNAQLGFKLALPASQKDWKLNAKPPAPLSVLVTSPDGTAEVSVGTVKLPLALQVEGLAPMLEAGPGMLLQDYKKISAGMVDAGGKKGFEMQYEGKEEGRPLRCWQRVYIVDATEIVLSARVPPAEWVKHEKAIKEIMDSFAFLEAKAGPAKEAPQPPAPKSEDPKKK